jgi:glycosyltransferase involved in cell wall biosynthesis
MQRILVTTNHPAPYMDRLFVEMASRYSVDVVYLAGASGTKEWRNLSSFSGRVSESLSLRDWRLAVERADLVIVGGWGSVSNRLLILCCLLLRKRFAVFSDAPHAAEKREHVRLVQSALLKMIPLFLIAGEHSGRIFEETYIVDPAKVRNFPYFPDWPDLTEAQARIEQRKIRVFGRETTVRLFLANRFVARKGYDTVLRAFEIMKQRGVLHRFEITIAGTGALYEDYADSFSALGDSVRLLGWLEAAEYEKRMSETDVYLHASEFEQYGIPVVDAALRGKCVVASSGVCSAVDLSNYGFPIRLFSPKDHAGLADILGEIEETRDIYRPLPVGNWRDKLPPRQIATTLADILATP